jgi:hypothetical protein
MEVESLRRALFDAQTRNFVLEVCNMMSHYPRIPARGPTRAAAHFYSPSMAMSRHRAHRRRPYARRTKWWISQVAGKARRFTRNCSQHVRALPNASAM